MHPRFHTLKALALLFAGSACSTVPRTATAHADSVPVEFVAWLCADACRNEFPGSDPLPYHAMAPATRRHDGLFEIRYQRREDGRWTAKAAGRLLATPASDHELPNRVDYQLARGLLGFQHPDAEVVVLVREAENRTERIGEVTLERGRFGRVEFVLPPQTTCTLRIEEVAAR